MAYVGLVLKATRLCNLRCAYCKDWQEGADRTMPFEVLARVVAAALRDPHHDAVDFMWHGGEPTLLPIRYYEKALQVEARFRRDGQEILNRMQTNGTRLTREWTRFWRDNGFRIGVSLDGPRDLHDRFRVGPSGRGSFDEVMAGVRLLREEGIPFSALVVLSDATLELGADRLFDFFLEHGLTRVALLAVHPANRPDGSPVEHHAGRRRVNEFLVRLHDRWEEHGDPGLWIREIATIRRRIAGERPNVCTMAGGCLGSYYLVEPGGEVAHCGYFLGDPDYTLGRIQDGDFARFRRGERLIRLQEEERRARERMMGCPGFRVCGGGCPYERYLGSRHDPRGTALCCGMWPLIEHVQNRMSPGARAPRA